MSMMDLKVNFGGVILVRALVKRGRWLVNPEDEIALSVRNCR